MPLDAEHDRPAERHTMQAGIGIHHPPQVVGNRQPGMVRKLPQVGELVVGQVEIESVHMTYVFAPKKNYF